MHPVDLGDRACRGPGPRPPDRGWHRRRGTV